VINKKCDLSILIISLMIVQCMKKINAKKLIFNKSANIEEFDFFAHRHKIIGFV
jgi:hypothetical protein